MIDDMLQAGDVLLARVKHNKLRWALVLQTHHHSCDIVFMNDNGTLRQYKHAWSRWRQNWSADVWTVMSVYD